MVGLQQVSHVSLTDRDEAIIFALENWSLLSDIVLNARSDADARRELADRFQLSEIQVLHALEVPLRHLLPENRRDTLTRLRRKSAQ